MAALEFVFDGPPAGSGDLVFRPASTGDDIGTVVNGVFAPLAAQISVVPYVEAAVSGTFAPLTATAQAQYSSQTQRPTVGRTEALHQVAFKLQTGPAQPQQDAGAAPVGWAAFWQRVTGAPAGVEHRLPADLRASRIDHRVAFTAGTAHHLATDYQQQDATPMDQRRQGLFQHATPVRDDTLFPHQNGTRVHQRAHSGFQQATPHRTLRGTPWQLAAALLRGWAPRHQDGVPPPIGISLLPVPPGPAPSYTPSGELVFQTPWSSGLNFLFVGDGYVPPTPPAEPVVVPVQRVYIVLNHITLRRTSDNAVVPTLGFGLSLDASSWTWGFNASLPAHVQALVEPANGPVGLSAWVNGTEFRVLAEQVSRERTFGQVSIRVSGRGINAALDTPYSPEQTFGNPTDRTHQQLFDDVLTINGVPMGWSIDYGLEAWNVPAGVWNHQGSHISALVRLAQAAGGYLVPHPSAQSFKVRHRYPVKPWEWGTVTPDFVLPADVMTREGLSWTEKPAYNRVYVSGQDQGVLGRVTRQGTAGDVLAPMVTDALITTAAAARQRGQAVLGDTGRQLVHTLRMPVLEATGIVQPGAFVRYQDGGHSRVGLVRGTQVDAGTRNETPEVWQTMEVECHV